MKVFLVAAVLLGGIFASGTAQAQLTERSYSREYGMVQLRPENQRQGFRAENLDISVLLPAVQKVRVAAARIKVAGEGFEVEIPAFGYADKTRTAKVMLWTSELVGSAGALKLVLNIKDQMGELRQVPIATADIAITILPAVQQDSEPLAASVRLNSVAEAIQADGSVRPILIGMLLPAVQKVRG